MTDPSPTPGSPRLHVFGAGATTGCPCGSGVAYAGCCGPLHDGQRAATTALELMRSRYSAFVVRDEAYLVRTWHPRTRPARLELEDGPQWLGLTVLATADGREGDPSGEVEFEASHSEGVLRERSHFLRRAGRWVYVDGQVDGQVEGDTRRDVAG